MSSNQTKKPEPATTKNQGVTNTPPSTASAAQAAPKKIDLTKPVIKDAIAKGQALIKEGKSKADAAMAMFELIKDEDKEVIAAAFVQGATLTEKGSVTYVYNCRRKAQKAARKN